MSDPDDFGLFGEMDIEDVPDDPWFVGQGTYFCTVTKAEVRAKKDNSGYALVIEYTINEPESDYHGYNKSDWFNLHPVKDYSKDLDSDQKKEVIRMKSRIMQAFDKTESETASLKKSTVDGFVGEKVYVKVVERTSSKPEHAGKVFSNIDSVTSERLFNEQNSGADSSLKEMGLSGM